MADTMTNQLVTVVDESKAVQFQGKKLPLYQHRGYHYFLDRIPVGMLERDEEAQPRQYDENQARKIAKSIDKKVLMQPLLTRYDPEKGVFLITEGQHRWRAMRDFLHEEGVPCIVYLDLNRHTALLCGLEANAEDRARALSGGDLARKTRALMEEYAGLLAKEFPEEPVSEEKVLHRMGHITRAEQKKFLVGSMLDELRESPSSRLAPYVADRQSGDKPLTAKNLTCFLERLVRTTPLRAGEPDLREDEFANVLRLTNIFADSLLRDGKWNPAAPKSAAHEHAVNICRRHPLEACGYFLAKVLDEFGGGDATIGACYAPTSDIRSDEVDREVGRILGDPIWDQDHIRFSRSIDDLKRYLTKALGV